MRRKEKEIMKKTYRVWAEMVTHCYIDIEAESEAEAKNIAEETDGGEFIPCHEKGSWDVTGEIEVRG